MSGNEVPGVGLGTFALGDHEDCVETVSTALEMGYRHLDTAQEYGTEGGVGDGIAAADVPRDEVFVATKIQTENLGYDDVLETAGRSRERLGLDTIDLLYVHFPLDAYDPAGTLRAFDELRDAGVIRHVGLSNFTIPQLDEARSLLDAPVFAHQIEMHPFLPQEALLEYAHEHGHAIVAHTPVARGDVFDTPELAAVAERHGVSEARVALAWLLSHENVAVVPKTASVDHLRDNLAAANLDLDQSDVDRIDGISDRRRYVERDYLD